MEASANNQTDSFTSGVDVEERRLTWRIKNFPVVLQHDSMTTSQEMSFYAGDSIGLTSKWSVYLSSKEMKGKHWAGIYIRIKERPSLLSEFLFVQCEFKLRNSGGWETIRKFETSLIDIYTVKENSGVGFSEFADRTGEVVSVEETAVIHIGFKIYSPSMIPPSVKDSVEEFRSKSKLKATLALEELLGDNNPNSSGLNVVKILSQSQSRNGDNGFYGKKEVLSARSPVFKVMLESPMVEANTGIIIIEDISQNALNVLLNYIYYGELLPEWKNPEILPELVNAAAKYQLPDLLHFLDGMMGKVCSLDNVRVLMILAGQLSLKKAEEELLRFVRMKGTSSAEIFLQILKIHSDSVREAPAERKGKEGHVHLSTSSGSSNVSNKRGLSGDTHVKSENSGKKAGKQWAMVDLTLL